jgi:hypothetical protein
LVFGYYNLTTLPHGFSNLVQVGYYVVDTPGFVSELGNYMHEVSSVVRHILGDVIIPDDPETIVNSLLKMKGEIWPMTPGPPLRAEGDRLFVDLYSATNQLNGALQLPARGGAIANTRSQHFENSVQDLIDRSQWRPNEIIRRYRQRPMRYHGDSLTDIDAIGCYGRILLLVSCKSIDYSPQYDVGEYRLVRNVVSLVEEAIKSWNRKCEFFRQSLVGDNYDFRGFDKIIGVVCTPHVMYTPIGVSTQPIADGLLAAASLSELNNWLHSTR